MTPDKMVRMANQIAGFFKTQPRIDSAEATARHLRDFWEPRMLQQLTDHAATGGAGLDPVALEAARLLQKRTA